MMHNTGAQMNKLSLERERLTVGDWHAIVIISTIAISEVHLSSESLKEPGVLLILP